MNWTNGIFCAGALVGSLVIAAIAYPYAAMPPEKLALVKEAQPADTLGEVNVGKGFGYVQVAALMDYYIENPPAPPAGGAAPKVRFGGC